MDTEQARKRFEAENKIEEVDRIYRYDGDRHRAQISHKSWEKDPNFFKKVRISAVALLKMVMHARSGGRIEVMGMMQGKIEGDTMIVMDSFALPVEGTEVRVNAAVEGYEYMVNYLSLIEQVGRAENAIGWYHSHPGYGCWLSGIDVGTQMLNQKFQEPWLAIVVDPVRTMSSGKVELGAFRTYPEGHTPPGDSTSEYQSIPIEKIEDFGVHCKRYYQLEVSYFKSTLDSHLLDLLWNKYWVSTLSSSPLLSSRDYFAGAVRDLTEKLEQAENQLAHSGRMGAGFFDKKEESKLSKVTKDSTKTTIEHVHGLMSQVIKDVLFNLNPKGVKPL